MDWSEVDAYKAEHEQLRAAADHVARAVAELLKATQRVGDHASTVSLREAAETLQMTQAQLAAAAERAFSMGQLAALRARHTAFQRQVDRAIAPGQPPIDLR